jgi:2-polyprenyl-6-methoxyphenol hydroxylase-like FAD-dependent oxidoreductase
MTHGFHPKAKGNVQARPHLGASVAGPALAFWLHRYGFKVTIVERASAIRSGGYAVDFRGTATHVLDCMGLSKIVKQHDSRAGSIAMVDAQGSIFARLPDGVTSGDIEILRGDLVKVLYESTRDDVTYIFDDSIRALRQTGEGVDVTFASGNRDRFDLVVGADGLHSDTTRALAFPDETRVRHPALRSRAPTHSPGNYAKRATTMSQPLHATRPPCAPSSRKPRRWP